MKLHFPNDSCEQQSAHRLLVVVCGHVQWRHAGPVRRAAKQGRVEAVELYDLGQDPSEKFNRITHHPDIAQRLMQEVKSFRAEFAKTRRPIGRIVGN